MALTPATADRIVELAQAGVKVFQVCRRPARARAPGRRTARPAHQRRPPRRPRAAGGGGLRDEVTLIVSGGIALAEHMAKAIICGADLVAVDTPLLVALGCRVCRRQEPVLLRRTPVPCDIAAVEPDYAAQRMVNLMGAWHSQLIEVLGAMGIREVRRLRGEVGPGHLHGRHREGGVRRSGPRVCDEVRCMSTEARPIQVRPATGRRSRSSARSARRPTATATSLGKYKIDRLAACKSCGRCVEVCQYGVHVKPEGYAFTLRPQDHLCVGPECAETEDPASPSARRRRSSCAATPAPTAWATRAGRAT